MSGNFFYTLIVTICRCLCVNVATFSMNYVTQWGSKPTTFAT